MENIGYDKNAREITKKVNIMKKIVMFSVIAGLFSGVALSDAYIEKVNSCDEYEMRAALDKAAADKRAVITIVECDNGIVRTVKQPAVKPVYNTCGCGCETKQAVVKREYFVRETVQTYKPVVQYVPDATYTRVKPVCANGCF